MASRQSIKLRSSAGVESDARLMPDVQKNQPVYRITIERPSPRAMLILKR